MSRGEFTTRRLCLLAGLCCAVILTGAACSTTLTATYWTPIVSGGAGDKTLDVDSDLGIKTGSVLYGEVLGEEGAQRLRFNYWQVKGHGSKANPSGVATFDFDAITVQAGNATSSTIDITCAEILYEPAFYRTPDFRLRGVIGFDLIQFFMRVRDVDDVEMAQVVVPGDPDGLFGWGVDYQLVLLVGGSVEVAFKPWLKLLARVQMFDDSSVNIAADVDGAFVGTAVDLVFGAQEGDGLAITVGYRDFSARYQYGSSTECKAKAGGLSVSLFFAF